MAHESFEDEEIARILNRSFVSIKVDREERPDIDAACQMLAKGQEPVTVISHEYVWPPLVSSS